MVTVTFDVVVDPDVVDGTLISNQAFVSAIGGGVVDKPGAVLPAWLPTARTPRMLTTATHTAYLKLSEGCDNGQAGASHGRVRVDLLGDRNEVPAFLYEEILHEFE